MTKKNVEAIFDVLGYNGRWLGDSITFRYKPCLDGYVLKVSYYVPTTEGPIRLIGKRARYYD
jgi:hypothetical protein